jgi:FkbM family methyltransferase
MYLSSVRTAVGGYTLGRRCQLRAASQARAPPAEQRKAAVGGRGDGRAFDTRIYIMLLALAASLGLDTSDEWSTAQSYFAQSRRRGGPGGADDPLERSAAHRSDASGCTLDMTPAQLASRKSVRLWASDPHWNAWVASGGDTGGNRRLTAHNGTWLRDRVIVEIGSFVGVDVINVLRRAVGNVTMHTFEPVTAYRKQLLQRVAQKISKARMRKLGHELVAHPYGLGNTSRRTCFRAFTGKQKLDGATTSEVPARDDGSCPASYEAFELRDAAAEFRKFSRIDIFQLNCEGCEYEVLYQLATGNALQAVREIEVQFHLDYDTRQADTKAYCRIEDALRRRGFRLVYRHPFLWERWAKPVL